MKTHHHLFVTAGAVVLALAPRTVQGQPVLGGTLDPLTIPKYVDPLVIPPVLYDDNGAAMSVDIAFRQFEQQVLPTGFPMTTLWGYGNPAQENTFFNPSFTIEVTKDKETTVKWINDLTKLDANGNKVFVDHVLKDATGAPIIDQTLHWAAPNGECLDPGKVKDCVGTSGAPYDGPVPMTVHVHGAHVGPGSDGYPESWWLPDASDIPEGYEIKGTFYESADGVSASGDCLPGDGCAVDVYHNDQPTTTLWYHDHALGITRLNVYAGGAGFWLIRDANDGKTGLLSGVLPGPPSKAGEDPNGDPTIRNAIREIPIAIQPKSFNQDGSQFYPADRAFFEGLGNGQTFAENMELNIPFLPNPASDIHAVWNPEAFFNTMVVNGKTWPLLEVAPERYRFRLLNAADSRFLNLALHLVNGQGTKIRELPFYQIGAEQSLLPQVVRIETGFATPLPGNGNNVEPNFPDCLLPNGETRKNCVVQEGASAMEQALLMAPSERADVIVDFSGLEDGDEVIMFNTGPDAPFGGFPDIPADINTTGQVMKFRVNFVLSNPGGDLSTPPESLLLNDAMPGGVAPLVGTIDDSTFTRDLALLELESEFICVDALLDQVPDVTPPDCPNGTGPFGPKAAVLGYDGGPGISPKVQLWADPVQQVPVLGSTEVWEFWNLSADAHPIHLHLVKFQVYDREAFDVDLDGNVVPTGNKKDPEFSEMGWKDTVIAYPGEVTRIVANFDIAGLYV